MKAEKLRQALVALLAVIATLIALPRSAFAAGTFKLMTNESTEVSGAWRVRVQIELPKAPLTAHQAMKFLFTKTVVYERTLVDGKSEPVLTRQTLQNQTPSVESLDVDFADPTGKIFKGTRFDFGLTRARGYEAGEYTVELRTSDGTTIGAKANLVLKGDNPVVDRRAMAFNAKEKSIKKIDAYDAGANQAKNSPDDTPPPAPNNQGEVTPTGTATGFVPKEGMAETDEEKIKTRSPSGCGCEVIGLPLASGPGAALFFLAPVLGVGLMAARRRRSRNA